MRPRTGMKRSQLGSPCERRVRHSSEDWRANPYRWRHGHEPDYRRQAPQRRTRANERQDTRRVLLSLPPLRSGHRERAKQYDRDVFLAHRAAPAHPSPLARAPRRLRQRSSPCGAAHRHGEPCSTAGGASIRRCESPNSQHRRKFDTLARAAPRPGKDGEPGDRWPGFGCETIAPSKEDLCERRWGALAGMTAARRWALGPALTAPSPRGGHTAPVRRAAVRHGAGSWRCRAGANGRCYAAGRGSARAASHSCA